MTTAAWIAQANLPYYYYSPDGADRRQLRILKPRFATRGARLRRRQTLDSSSSVDILDDFSEDGTPDDGTLDAGTSDDDSSDSDHSSNSPDNDTPDKEIALCKGRLAFVSKDNWGIESTQLVLCKSFFALGLNEFNARTAEPSDQNWPQNNAKIEAYVDAAGVMIHVRGSVICCRGKSH